RGQQEQRIAMGSSHGAADQRRLDAADGRGRATSRSENGRRGMGRVDTRAVRADGVRGTATRARGARAPDGARRGTAGDGTGSEHGAVPTTVETARPRRRRLMARLKRRDAPAETADRTWG